MLVQFEKTLCLKHKLPFQYICGNYKCKCSIRLCLKCAQEHPRKKDIDNSFLKQDGFSKRLKMQTQLMPTCYRNIHNYKGNQVQVGLLNSKNSQSIQMVSNCFRTLDYDKKTIFKVLQQFNFNHYESKKKLNKTKNECNSGYLSQISNKQLVPLLVNLSSESGLEKIQKKMIVAHEGCQIYSDFIKKVQTYGTNTKQFLRQLGFKQQNLLKSKLNYCLSKWRGNKKVQINHEKTVRQNSNKGRKKEENEKKVQPRINAPPRKFSLIRAKRRPSTSANKQNN